jgi:transcriptional regulator with XRE-family HTH domain
MGDGPTIRRRQLGLELRRLRTAAGLTGTQAAAELGKDQSRVSRLETGAGAATVPELKVLLDLYGATTEETAELLDLARNSGRRESWTVHYSAAPKQFRRFIQLEREAAQLCSYQPELLPGLIQTEGFIRVTFGMMADLWGIDQTEMESRIRLRLDRQAILTTDSPPELRIVVNEAALRRPIGGPTVMRAQLLRAAEVADRPNITIQVLPFAVGEHPALGASFLLLRFPNESVPATVYLEDADTASYLEQPEEISRYSVMFDRLTQMALDTDQSQEMIVKIADEYL